jgi:hypothetical protein
VGYAVYVWRTNVAYRREHHGELSTLKRPDEMAETKRAA